MLPAEEKNEANEAIYVNSFQILLKTYFIDIDNVSHLFLVFIISFCISFIFAFLLFTFLLFAFFIQKTYIKNY